MHGSEKRLGQGGGGLRMFHFPVLWVVLHEDWRADFLYFPVAPCQPLSYHLSHSMGMKIKSADPAPSAALKWATLLAKRR